LYRKIRRGNEAKERRILTKTDQSRVYEIHILWIEILVILTDFVLEDRERKRG